MLSQHKTLRDIWFSVHDQVYDVTNYLGDHPGGEEVLLDRGGQDATEDFEDVGHSNDARRTLARYRIGALPPSERRPKRSANAMEASNGLGLLVALLVVIVAAGVYFFFVAGGD
jgi:cytochrome b involved in lipid metabolism